jgi:hypothetical protein
LLDGHNVALLLIVSFATAAIEMRRQSTAAVRYLPGSLFSFGSYNLKIHASAGFGNH